MSARLLLLTSGGLPFETLGNTQNNATGTAFSGMQTTDFWTPTDLTVSKILWDLTQVGTYELRVDGVLINTRTSVNGVGVNMMQGVAPISMSRGQHLIKITKTSGSSGWNYRSGTNTWVDNPWYHAGYWHEATGGETIPFRIRARPTTDILFASPNGAISHAGSNYAGQTYTITWNNAVKAYGLMFAAGTLTTYEALIDGVVVGTSPTLAGLANSGGEGYTGWIDFDSPQTFIGGVAYTVTVRRVGGANYSGQGYISTASPTGPYFSQTVWTQHGSFSPAIFWRFTEIGSDLVVPAAVATTTTIGAPTIQTDTTVAPATIETIVTVGTPIVPTATPDTVVTVTIIGTPTITIGADVAPATVQTTTTIGTPVIPISQTVAPATVATTVTIGAPVIGLGTNVAPATVTTTTTIGAPAISVEFNATPAPATIATTVFITTPRVGFVAPATVQTTTTIGAPVVSTVTHVTFTPATVITRVFIGTPGVASISEGDGSAVAAGGLFVVILATNQPVYTDPGPGVESVSIPGEDPPSFPQRQVAIL